MFFHSGRGLRQGCPLSLVLFVFLIEILSRILRESDKNEKINRLKLSYTLALTRVLFVYDVILFVTDNMEEWKIFSRILYVFCLASSIILNLDSHVYF